jgi:hypothetical protein
VQVFDDQLKAMFGAITTFVLLMIVLIQSTGENLAYHRGQISMVNLAVFTLGSLFVVIWFIVRGASEKFGELFALLGRVTQAGTVKGELDSVGGVGDFTRRRRRAIGNLWIPVTLQFALAGWLIYCTGGIMNTPYNPVPIVMMLIGQSVYVTPSIDLPTDTRVRSMFMVIWRITRAYLYPQLMFASLLVAVVLLQERYPLVTHPAPPLEVVLTILVSLFVSMCVVFLTRSVDQATRQRTH